MSLPPWDQETFSFGWTPYINNIPQCSTINVGFSNDLGDPSLHADPAPAPPYTISIYQGGYAPLTLAVGNIGQKGSYPWNVNLPVGTEFMMTMKDSAQYTGGTSQRCTVVSGSSGCSVRPMPTPTLSFTRTGNSQCGNVNIVVNNGTSPYQLEIIPEVRQQKTLHFETNKMGFVLDLPAGISHFLVITDSQGNSYADGIMQVGASSDSSCLNAAATMSVGQFTSVFSGSGVIMPSTTVSSSTSTSTGTQSASNQGSTVNSHIGVIVGAAAGGVIVIAAIIFLACWFLRRKRAQRRNAALEQQQVEAFKPETTQTQPGYTLPYGYTTTHPGVVETYGPPIIGAVQQPYGVPHDLLPTRYDGITTHAPQARPPSQTVSYYDSTSAGQSSPGVPSFSHGSGTTSPLMGVHNTGEGNSTPAWGADRKQRVNSTPDSNNGGQAYPWGVAASPPPRSFTATALPPYEREPPSQEHPRN